MNKRTVDENFKNGYNHQIIFDDKLSKWDYLIKPQIWASYFLSVTKNTTKRVKTDKSGGELPAVEKT